jgi:hypothetical protein
LPIVTVLMEVISSSETSVFSTFTRHHIPEEAMFQDLVYFWEYSAICFLRQPGVYKTGANSSSAT